MIMYAKYQCSIINTSEDMSQVKVFVTDRQTDRQLIYTLPSINNYTHTKFDIHFQNSLNLN